MFATTNTKKLKEKYVQLNLLLTLRMCDISSLLTVDTAHVYLSSSAASIEEIIK